jgi:photosystem II stability/assembly factor-like uncharacterized protein
MNTMSAIELLETANPDTNDPTHSVDDAWFALRSRLSQQKRSWRKPLVRSGRGPIIAPQHRWIAVIAASAVLIIGLVVVVGSGVTSDQPPQRSATIHSRVAAFSLLSATAPAGFASTGGSPQGFNQMSCPTSQVCYLESVTPKSHIRTAYHSTDGGVTWLPLTIPAGLWLDTAFSCYGADNCMVGAELTNYRTNAGQVLLSTTDGGTSWQSEPVPMASVTGSDAALDPSIANSTGSLYQLQCFSAQSCVAFGNVPSDRLEEPYSETPATGVSPTVVLRTQDGGNSWSSTVIPWSTTPTGTPAWSNQQHATFSCSSQTTCLGLATVWGRPDGTPGGQPSYLLELSSSDGGSTWSSSWVANVQASPEQVVCPDQSNCYALVGFDTIPDSNGLMMTADGGATWSSTQQPLSSANGGWDALTSISCPSATTCWAAGHVRSTTNPSLGAGVMFETQDGGQTWSNAQLPSGIGSVNQLDCTSVQSCLAIAQPPYAPGAEYPIGPIFSEVLTNAPVTPT